MAVEHQPLMDTALACAAMSISYKISTDATWMVRMRRKTLLHYTSAVTAMRECIESGAVSDTEDWLLATVNNLTLFEVCRVEPEVQGERCKLNTD